MEGRIWGESLAVEIETGRAHCAAPIRIGVNSDLEFTVRDGGAAPLVFAPEVDFEDFRAPNILDDI